MARFSIKDMMAATALASVGLGFSSYVLNLDDARGFSSGQIACLIGLYFAGWFIVGYGLGILLKRPRLGLIVGFMLGTSLLMVWRFNDNSVLWWLHVKGFDL